MSGDVLSVFVICIVLFIGLEVVLQVLVRIYRNTFQWLIIRKDETPVFSEELIEKYMEISFDPVLGWARKAGTRGKDKSPEGDAEFNISSDGSRFNPAYNTSNGRISVFGDSFAFCRLVNDDETWPYFLSKKLGENVANFGVGNYGLDQAYLRMLYQTPAAQRQVVIMGVVPETILRIHSQWKHYLEYGNILAFKPAFRLSENGLQEIPNPVTTREDFANINEISKKLRKTDPFYRQKFCRDVLSFPFVFSAIKNPKRLFGILWSLAIKGKEKGYQAAFETVLKDNHRLQERYYRDPKAIELLEQMVIRFAKTCYEQGHKPVLMVLPQPNDMKDAKTKTASYREVFRGFEVHLPVLDLMDLFVEKENEMPIYKAGSLGAHTSADVNREIACYLENFLRKNEIISSVDGEK